ncbi:CIC11C00000004305 [Sungouiella intermedia]|uniref:CIC11C00000004305 n=1 Tax=Sungouiella intermedia TaxID=45354 RepID=A0A1L0DL05_9ASCO|nr:CIC11C00000004305 [[Candida] intermedia]
MNEKGRMDDLASLFLPDLLQPLADLPSRKPLEEFVFHGRSDISTPLSSGLGMFMALSEDADLAPVTSGSGPFGNGVSGPSLGPSTNSGPSTAGSGPGATQPYQPGTYIPTGPNPNQMGYYPQPLYNPAFPNTDMGVHNNFQRHHYSMFPDLDFAHALRYAEFIPAEAGFQQSHCHHQMMPVQQAFSLSTVIGQFDSVGWPQGDDMGHTGAISYGRGTPEMGALAGSTGPMLVIENAEKLEIKQEVDSLASQTRKSKKPLLSDRTKGDQDIQMDYSPSALDNLLKLAPSDYATHPPVQLTDGEGNPVKTYFTGTLDGRLLTNDYDNYNLICSYSGTPNPNEVYTPRVISCYRRNFVSAHLKFTMDKFPLGLYLNGEPVTQFRIKIGAVTDGKEQKGVLFMIVNDKDKSTKKERNRNSIGGINLLDKNSVIELQECDRENDFWIKKLQFRSATSNSSSLNLQTYYRITASIEAETNSSSAVLHDIMGACMTVRGRNPTFFQDRKDFRIKTGPGEGSEVTNINKHHTDTVTVPVVQNPLLVKEEDIDDVQPEKEVESEPEKESKDSTDASDGDGETSNQSDAQVSSRAVQTGISRVASVGDFIASKIQDAEKNYHYFPILNVYYLPPINVVYFPHGAHQDNTGGDGTTSREGETTTNAPNAPGEKKRRSKVYFR